MSEKLKSCPDCEGSLVAIKLLDETIRGGMIGFRHHGPLAFALETTERKAYLGQFETGGVVKGFLCSDCSRMFFYGDVRGEDLG